MGFNFSMPSGWDTGDSPAGLFGLGSGLGSGYDYATTDAGYAPTMVGQSMNDLQSGSSSFDWGKAYTDTLGALVSGYGISQGLQGNAQSGYYKAANGQTYPLGYGPTMGVPTGGTNGMLMWVLIIGAVVLILKD
jgi:hypothetical protein